MDIKISIIEGMSRPIFSIKYPDKDDVIHCLIDTGAAIPVWCDTLKNLYKVYPNTHKSDKKVVIGGFSPEDKPCDVYVIDKFVIKGDNGVNLTYNKVHVAYNKNLSIGCSLILSAPMFNKMSLTINRKDERRPFVTISTDKTNMAFCIQPVTINGIDYIQKAYVCASSEPSDDLELHNLDNFTI